MNKKMLSRYILTQARQKGDDLAVLKTRVDRIEETVDRLEQSVGHIDPSLSALGRDLPSMGRRHARFSARDEKPVIDADAAAPAVCPSVRGMEGCCAAT